MPKVDFTGLGVALVTPFMADASVDYEALQRLLDYQLNNGVDYLVALGTTAETPTLCVEEQLQITRFILDYVADRVPVVVGMGSNCTSDLVRKLKSDDFAGISAVLSVTPYYNKPTQEGLYKHYCALSEVSPVPIILYNVPGRTGVNMTAETTLRIARQCKNIIAIKEASGSLEQIKTIIDGAPDNFQVISGDDALTTDVILLGGVGVISVFGNSFPKEMKTLVECALHDKSQTMREEMERNYAELFRLMFIEGNPSGVKYILYEKGFISNVLRLPLLPVSNDTEKRIQIELQKMAR